MQHVTVFKEVRAELQSHLLSPSPCREPPRQAATHPDAKGYGAHPHRSETQLSKFSSLSLTKLSALGAALRGLPPPQYTRPRPVRLSDFCARPTSRSGAIPQELVPSWQSPRESHCSRAAGTTLRPGSARPPRQIMLQHRHAGTFWVFPSLQLPGQQSPRRGSSNEHPAVRCCSAKRHLPAAVTVGTGKGDSLLLLFPSPPPSQHKPLVSGRGRWGHPF